MVIYGVWYNLNFNFQFGQLACNFRSLDFYICNWKWISTHQSMTYAMYVSKRVKVVLGRWFKTYTEIRFLDGGYFKLRPLHTRANSREHEIVRVQKKCQKVNARHFQNHVVWSRALKCNENSYVTGLLAKCYINEFLFMRVLTRVET